MPDDQVRERLRLVARARAGDRSGRTPAWTLDEGSDLAVQLHMIGSGAAEMVEPTIGLYFSSTPPTRTPVVIKLESKVDRHPRG